jgi:hypothetical protein
VEERRNGDGVGEARHVAPTAAHSRFPGRLIMPVHSAAAAAAAAASAASRNRRLNYCN